MKLRDEAKARAKVDLSTFVQKVNEEIDPEENLLNEFFSEVIKNQTLYYVYKYMYFEQILQNKVIRLVIISQS